MPAIEIENARDFATAHKAQAITVWLKFLDGSQQVVTWGEGIAASSPHKHKAAEVGDMLRDCLGWEDSKPDRDFRFGDPVVP